MSKDTEGRFLGSLYGYGSGYAGCVWDTESVAPTLSTMQGGGRQPHIVEVRRLDKSMKDTVALRMVRTEEGKKLRKAYEAHEIHHGYNEHREAEPRTDGLSNTITTVQKDNYLLEQTSVKVKQATSQGYIECELGGVANLSFPDSQTRRGRVIENGKVSPTLTTESVPSVLEKFTYEIDGETYLVRIRKLTPRECWRLMGFTDEVYDKAESAVSSTQLYKQAGNSIVKQVLMAIFSQMVVPQDKRTMLKKKSMALLDLI